MRSSGTTARHPGTPTSPRTAYDKARGTLRIKDWANVMSPLDLM